MREIPPEQDVNSRIRNGEVRQPEVTSATPAQLAFHNNFKVSVRTLKRSLLRSIYYLRIIRERRIYKALGYDTIPDYAAAEAGLGRKQCEAFLSLGRKLNRLPEVTSGLESGRLTWRQAQEICRVAAPESESRWIETAANLTVRELESEVKRSRDGDSAGPSETDSPVVDRISLEAGQGTPARPEPRRTMPILTGKADEGRTAPQDTPVFVTLRFTPDLYATWESWLVAQRRNDTKASKETLLCTALECGAGTGESVMRTVIHLCPRCESAELKTGRGDFVVPGALLERARCDGETQHPDGRVARVIPPRMKRSVLARDGHRCRAKGCQHTRFLQLHHIKPRAAGGPTSPQNLIALCSRCHRALHEGERELEDLLERAP